MALFLVFSMPSYRIHHLFGFSNGRLLIVFYTEDKCYQFRIALTSGKVFGSESIFYTELAALNEGRLWLNGKDQQ